MTRPTLEDVLALGRAKASGVDPAPSEPAVEPLNPVEEARMRARRRAMREHGFGLPRETGELVVAGKLYSTQPLDIVEVWLGAPTPVLILAGDPGTGKSVAAAHGALARLTVGPPLYVLESTLAEWRWGRKRYAAEWARMLAASTVVIDEVGRTERDRKELARIATAEMIHERTTTWPWGRKTILTANLSLEDLTDALDPRLEDRLAEIGSVRHVAGPSLRGAR